MEIVKSYVQHMPACRFIGKKYGSQDRDEHGSFGRQWTMWWKENWLDAVERAAGDVSSFFEDADAPVGLMRSCEGEACEYWIGKFTPSGTDVPEGYGFVDFPASSLGVCWYYGRENTLFCKEYLAAERLIQEGYRIIRDSANALWFFERYACPRFTTPDGQGNVILDIAYFVG